MRFHHMIRQGPQRKSFGHHTSTAIALGGRPNYKPSRGPSNFEAMLFFIFAPINKVTLHDIV